jgi:hypothetical protein
MAQERPVRTVAISLSKAMKVKNRLAGRLSKVQQNITAYNSVLEGRRGEVDVVALDKMRGELVEALIILKTAITDASRGIQRTIYEVAEKKSEIEFLNSLNTRNGTEPAYGLNAQPQVYVAAIQMKDVGERVKRLESEIDTLQDRIDNFNSLPERIQVDARVLELAS